MNPQANNEAEALKQRLSQLPQARPSGHINVPARASSGISDIDDSAFAIEEPKPQQIARPAPVAVPTRQAPAAPLAFPVAAPPAVPAQAPVRPEQVALPTAQAPSPPPQPAPQPIAAQQPAAQARPAPAPVIATAPSVPQPVAQAMPQPAPAPPLPAVAAPVPPLVSAVPLSNPPVLPTPVTPPQPPVPPKIPPMSVATVEPALVAPPAAPVAAAAPVVNVPPPAAPTGPHVSSDLIERIDETPQQSSRDIEGLIEHNHRLHRLKGFASFLLFVSGVVIAAFLINQFIFQSYYVDGTSMTPTLQNDDRLIIDKVERSIAHLQNKPYIPQRGQIVVLDSSIVGFNGREEQLIKRVIGLPGDTITVKDGAVTIKNKQNPDGFDPARQLGLNLQPTYVDSPQEWTIEEGHVFVMGDNRVENGSYDSRAFGPIEVNKIVGRLWARILPIDKAQTF